MTLYWAYGSNLNIQLMTSRCPGAVKLGAYVMPDTILRFRGIADVAVFPGAECPGGLWEITEADEARLDVIENVSGGLYAKRFVTIQFNGRPHQCLVYQLSSTAIREPSPPYLETIRQGYRDFNLDETRLNRAVDHAFRRRTAKPRRLARRVSQ